MRGKYFVKEVFLRLSAYVCLYYCVVMMLHEHVDDDITTIVEGNPKVHISIDTILTCRGWHDTFSCIAPLYS